jgi:hypothetical protein
MPRHEPRPQSDRGTDTSVCVAPLLPFFAFPNSALFRPTRSKLTSRRWPNSRSSPKGKHSPNLHAMCEGAPTREARRLPKGGTLLGTGMRCPEAGPSAQRPIVEGPSSPARRTLGFSRKDRLQRLAPQAEGEGATPCGPCRLQPVVVRHPAWTLHLGASLISRTASRSRGQSPVAATTLSRPTRPSLTSSSASYKETAP